MMKKVLFCCFISFLFYTGYGQQLFSISGKISDKSGQPVAAANVKVLNTDFAISSDENGNYNFQNLSSGKYTLMFSAVGYANTIVEIFDDKVDEKIINVSLADASSVLDEVVVSSQKQEEKMQKVPVSITSLSSQQVKQLRLWSSDDLSAIVPGLYLAGPGDDRNAASIRGIGTTSYDPAVAVYIDGVNQFSLDTYINQLNNIERIEVLRGPQGTLYGRNAMGGVINIITKKPSDFANAFAEINIGNYGQQRYAIGFNTPLAKKKLYAGVSFLFNKKDGFYKNEFNNQSFDKQHIFNGNYYLKYIAGNKWSFLLNAKHNNNRNDGAFPLVNIFATDPFNPPYVVSQDAIATMIDNTFNTSFSVNYTGSRFNFSSQTAYQFNHRYYNKPLDGDFSPIDGVTIINNYDGMWNKVKVFTQEFKFNSPANNTLPVKWTTGLYLFSQNNPNKQAVHFGKDAAMVGAPDTDFSIINSQKANNTGAALFGQLTYAINQKLSLIGGLRYDYENHKYNVKGEYQKDPDPAPQFETQPDTTAMAHFSAVSPKLGLSYEISAGSNLFATYSRGFRTGGFTQLSSDPSQPPLYAYKPEYSDNIEIGIKNTFFERKLMLNIALFNNQVMNVQVPTLILPDAITITRNAGRLNSKGAELELSATPFKGLQLDYNFGYTHARYKTLKLSVNGSEADLNGNKQIFTPETTSFLALQYSYPLSTHKLKLVARAEWMRTGKTYFDLSNNISQNPYSLINTRFGLSAKWGELMLWGRNLANKKYISYSYDFGAVHLGNPQTIGFTLSYNIDFF